MASPANIGFVDSSDRPSVPRGSIELGLPRESMHHDVKIGRLFVCQRQSGFWLTLLRQTTTSSLLVPNPAKYSFQFSQMREAQWAAFEVQQIENAALRESL